jgi:UDP-N-acetylglucosamine 2-epimerase (non-hydrolysing)
MTTITTVCGTRPEIIKLSKLVPLLDKNFDNTFMFTCQHYSKFMVDNFFDELGIRKPDQILDVKSSSYPDLIKSINTSMKENKPSYVIVYGDTNSTLAAAIVAKNLNIKLIHIEAGLRSFDKEMPEEFNRVITDHASDILFTPTELTKTFLLREKIDKNVFVVGNPVVDVCLQFVPKAENSKILEKLDLEAKNYLLLTQHRQEYVDVPERLAKILLALENLEQTVVFPIHPRTKKRLEQFNLKLPSNVIATEPLGYLDFLKLLKNAEIVLTDSGGVQEEAITLKVPCLTTRNSTERWESVMAGGNILVGIEPNLIGYYVKMIKESDLGEKMRNTTNPYGDGTTSEQIINILKRCL